MNGSYSYTRRSWNDSPRWFYYVPSSRWQGIEFPATRYSCPRRRMLREEWITLSRAERNGYKGDIISGSHGLTSSSGWSRDLGARVKHAKIWLSIEQAVQLTPLRQLLSIKLPGDRRGYVPESFDSRYVGPVRRSAIVSTAAPASRTSVSTTRPTQEWDYPQPDLLLFCNWADPVGQRGSTGKRQAPRKNAKTRQMELEEQKIDLERRLEIWTRKGKAPCGL